MAQPLRGRRLMGEINVVPYIDVMLVLLIIFMVTAPLLTQGVKVDLPKAGAQAIDAENKKPLVVTIDAYGNLYMDENSREAIDKDTLEARAAAALEKEPELPVLVKADRKLEYGRVVDAMVILQRVGAKKVGLVTDPLPEPKRRS